MLRFLGIYATTTHTSSKSKLQIVKIYQQTVNNYIFLNKFKPKSNNYNFGDSNRARKISTDSKNTHKHDNKKMKLQKMKKKYNFRFVVTKEEKKRAKEKPLRKIPADSNETANTLKSFKYVQTMQ